MCILYSYNISKEIFNNTIKLPFSIFFLMVCMHKSVFIVLWKEACFMCLTLALLDYQMTRFLLFLLNLL